MSFQFFKSPLGQVKPLKIEALGLELSVRITPDISGGELALLETVNAPGFGPPLHRHKETEIFRVLEGRYLFQVDDKRFEAGEGDVVSVPGGAVHAFVNITEKASEAIGPDAPGNGRTRIFPGLERTLFDKTEPR